MYHPYAAGACLLRRVAMFLVAASSCSASSSSLVVFPEPNAVGYSRDRVLWTRAARWTDKQRESESEPTEVFVILPLRTTDVWYGGV